MTTDQQPQCEALESRRVWINGRDYLDRAKIKDAECGGSSCCVSQLEAPSRSVKRALAGAGDGNGAIPPRFGKE